MCDLFLKNVHCDFVQASKINRLNNFYSYLVGSISGKNWLFVNGNWKNVGSRQEKPLLEKTICEYHGIELNTQKGILRWDHVMSMSSNRFESGESSSKTVWKWRRRPQTWPIAKEE